MSLAEWKIARKSRNRIRTLLNLAKLLKLAKTLLLLPTLLYCSMPTLLQPCYFLLLLFLLSLLLASL